MISLMRMAAIKIMKLSNLIQFLFAFKRTCISKIRQDNQVKFNKAVSNMLYSSENLVQKIFKYDPDFIHDVSAIQTR